MNPGLRKFAKGALALLGIAAFAAAGVAVGHRWRPASRPEPAQMLTSLAVGDSMPLATLRDEAGNPVELAGLLGQGAGVLLFIDPECPPCALMTRKWERAVQAGAVSAARVLAISQYEPATNTAYRQESGISYAVLSDGSGALHRASGIHAWPLEVAVRDGRVAAVSGEYAAEFESSESYAVLRGGGSASTPP